MDKIIEGKKSIKGTIEIPGDKSISHRAVILGSIAQGTSIISGLARSRDVQSTIQAMLKAGISIYEKNRKMVIEGKGITGFENRKKATPIEIDCGNSGTTARLLIGLFSGAGFPARFIGDASLMKRPMDRVVDPISKIGVQITSNKGYLPVEIRGGTPAPFEYTVPVASAQVKAACLLAALFIGSSSVVTEISGTRDHTERMLVLMDADIKTRNTLHGKSIIISGRRELAPLDIVIPGDVSSAVFFITAALVCPSSKILLKNVLLNPTRAHILEVFKRMGGNIEVELIDELPERHGNVRVRSSGLKGTVVGGVEIPLLIDEIPALAAAACFAKGETAVRGAQELRVKESDRIRGIVDMVRGFGGKIKELDDGFVITGKTRPDKGRSVPVKFESFGDHRLAMAASILALNVRGASVIHGVECVDVSFPGYFDELEKHTAE